MRIYREGVLNDEAFRIFLRNSRFPDILAGATSARVLAGVPAGRAPRRGAVRALRRRQTVLAAWAIFEAQCRDTIRKTLETRIPDGTYESEDAVDGDGMSGRSFHVRMRLTKEGGRISLDTRESDDQARGPINFIMHESVPKLILGIYLLSGHPTVLLNDGAQDAIDEVLVRPGSILQPHWPAALGNRAHTLARVQSNVLALLALATGGDVAAPNSVYNIYFLRGFDRARRVLPVQRRRRPWATARGRSPTASTRSTTWPRRTTRPSSWRWCSRCACAATRSTRIPAARGASAAAPGWCASWSCWPTRRWWLFARTTSCSHPPA